MTRKSNKSLIKAADDFRELGALAPGYFCDQRVEVNQKTAFQLDDPNWRLDVNDNQRSSASGYDDLNAR